MKSGKKKPGRDETGVENPDGEVVVGHDTRDNPHGIDAIRALQIIAGGIVILILIWFILRNILHII